MSVRGKITAWGVVAALGLAPGRVLADPTAGEARSITRDTDRVYTVVAGEGDGASTVTNPANLGFLRAANAVVDLSWTAPRSRGRGSGVGAFVGVPFPSLRRSRWLPDVPWATLGLGYQFLYPVQIDRAGTDDNSPNQSDFPYSKFSVALGVPLERWAPGLSLGFSYSRLVSSSNFHARLNQFDVGIGYWPSRFLALGVVVRGANVPQSGGDTGKVSQSAVIDPEFAVRPLGTGALEFAVGARITPAVPADVRWRVHQVAPRGRLFVSAGPVRLFAEAERLRYFPKNGDSLGSSAARDGAKLIAGVELSSPHFGAAVAVLSSAGGRTSFSGDGGAARLRFSAERYHGLVAAPQRVTRVRLAKLHTDRELWQVIGQIDEIGRRRGKALLELRGLSLGWAQVEELREAILAARLRGAKIFAYLHGGTLRHYFLATSATTILAHPTAALSILGMRIESFYFADLLAKLGAKADFVRIAEYKAVPETYEQTTASAPTASQRKLLISDLWNHVIRTISRERGQDTNTVKRWIDEAPVAPARAQRDGLVDHLAYPDQLDAKLEDLLGHKVRIEQASPQVNHRRLFGGQPHVAVVFIEGDISDSVSFTVPLVNRAVAGSQTLTAVLENLRNDSRVQAVVVRINSPGGSVSASDAIARELDLMRGVKPVVISMGDRCASGGYYIATGGQYIFAAATTLTGSIGIFYPKVDLSGTLKLFGVSVDSFNFGQRAGLRSPWKPYTEDERAAVARGIQDSYDVFTRRVARARSMKADAVDKVARGRVWSGVRAIEVGLVDAHGGLREAILRARAMAGLAQPNGAQGPVGHVVLYPTPPSELENLQRVFGIDLGLPFVRGRSGSNGPGGYSGVSAHRSRGLALPLVRVLRMLPTSLWLSDGPTPLALAQETLDIRD